MTDVRAQPTYQSTGWAFLTRRHISAREAVEGSSFVVAILLGTALVLIGFTVWRRSHS